jgi:hypothetical protein
VQGQAYQSGRDEGVETKVSAEVGASQLNDEGDSEEDRREKPEHDASGKCLRALGRPVMVC